MDSTTFHPFTKLPKEIQLLIWEHAANPAGNLKLLDTFIYDVITPSAMGDYREILPLINRFFFSMSRTWFNAYFSPTSTPFYYATSWTRNNLTMTCRDARQVVLGCWVKDIRAIEVWGELERRTEQIEGKRKTVEMLDGLLGDLKFGDGSRA